MPHGPGCHAVCLPAALVLLFGLSPSEGSQQITYQYQYDALDHLILVSTSEGIAPRKGTGHLLRRKCVISR
jgi:hypothetical protein